MNGIISLGKARKKKDRAAKEKRASENRVKFGRTKAEKKLMQTKNKKAAKTLSDHKVED